MQLIYKCQLFLVHTGLAGTGYAVEQSISYQLEAGCTVCSKVQISTLTISNAVSLEAGYSVSTLTISIMHIGIGRSRKCDGVLRV